MLPGVETTYALMEQDANALILCGHTHIPAEIEHNGKRVLNPGSVGVPKDSGGKSQFMILHGADGAWQHEFVSLDYDVERVIAELYEEELHIKAPYWCKVTEKLLRTGKIHHGTVLARAMELYTEEYGACTYYFPPLSLRQ